MTSLPKTWSLLTCLLPNRTPYLSLAHCSSSLTTLYPLPSCIIVSTTSLSLPKVAKYQTPDILKVYLLTLQLPHTLFISLAFLVFSAIKNFQLLMLISSTKSLRIECCVFMFLIIRAGQTLNSYKRRNFWYFFACIFFSYSVKINFKNMHPLSYLESPRFIDFIIWAAFCKPVCRHPQSHGWPFCPLHLVWCWRGCTCTSGWRLLQSI